MTFYRLSWGVAIPFFIKPWTVKVGIGWVYGMAGLFTIALWFPVLLLVWKGPTLRRWSLIKGSVSPEDGMAVFEMQRTSCRLVLRDTNQKSVSNCNIKCP